MNKYRFLPKEKTLYDMKYDLKKTYNIDKKLEDIINEYDYFEIAKKEQLDKQSISLSGMIKISGLKRVMVELSDRYTIDQILEMLDIKDVQQFLRKKKLEQLKTKDDV